MLAPISTIKKVSKQAVRPRFLQSVAVCCMLVFAWFIGAFSSSLSSVAFGNLGYVAAWIIVLLFAIFPLFLGVLHYFRRLIFEQEDSVLVIFKYFSSPKEYARALRFTISLFARYALAALLVFSPSIIIALLSNETIYHMLNIELPDWISILWMVNSFATILAVIGLIFITLKYYISAFIFIGNDNIAPREAINFSITISKRTGGDFFGLMFSFTPILLLSFFIAPLIFTLPRILSSYCFHCRFAITAYNLDVDRLNASRAPSFTAEII